MFQVRIHGRGGQGVVTAAELLAQAGFDGKKHAQAFPSFGSERTGAPVVSFCRLSDSPIRVREPIMNPDALIIQDATLLKSIDVFSGLKPEGYVLINAREDISKLAIPNELIGSDRIKVIAATDIAIKNFNRPVPNSVLLGGFSALTQVISIEGVLDAIRHKFKAKVAEGNCNAAQEAFDLVSRMVTNA
jgi:pyruvate ferredoxin oxidoreductase gamma subunit